NRVRFYYPSRRQHTTSKRNLSSDMCSSDLGERVNGPNVADTFFDSQAARKCLPRQGMRRSHGVKEQFGETTTIVIASTEKEQLRSEERRVGKEWRSKEWG